VTKNSSNLHFKNVYHTTTFVVRAITITYWNSARKNTRETQISFNATEIMFTIAIGS